MTLRMSNAHLGVAPPLPQLEPHVMELDLSDDKTHPFAATDISFTSTAPLVATPSTGIVDSKIVDAIAALFAHINVIHSDWVQRIRLVHERVDRIVEHQELDIKAILDTLSALYSRHTKFINDVNDFINSIRRR
ncbi:hypothetical protein Acr_08g0017750 [Actinidia rufa]|uniref:Uncharacterized protein n=1 Tax=Actinidia rufa TaxID=165716 RepID=A0A7J0F587_9ERIC|nr:hypothetical protein Acr_08g0017750 [Actinidia rufa]